MASKRITIRHVPSTHPARSWDRVEGLPIWLRKWFEKYTYTDSDLHTVCAYHQGKLIGVFRYHYSRQRQITACGTYIQAKYRGKGIGRRMWDLAIRVRDPRSIYVVTISLKGYRLVGLMKGLYPQLKWHWLSG